MGFFLYTSNKLEALAGCCADVICGSPQDDPMRPENIVIQTQGMALWLKQFIARKAGIAANIECPFLNNYVEKIVLDAFPDISFDSAKISPSVMSWRIYGILSENPEAYFVLDSYIRGDRPDLRRFQLSCRIAEIFDQYQIFRPEMLAGWRKPSSPKISDPSEEWQRKLFLDATSGLVCRDELLMRFITSAGIEDINSGDRISVFGVGTMPPLYLNFFRKLSEFRDVHFFYLNPCEEYWEYQYSLREKKKLSAKYRQDWETFSSDGNPLLASFGAQGREFFSEIMKLPELILSGESRCFEPYVNCMSGDPDSYSDYTRLSAVQQDILSMTGRGESLFSDGDISFKGSPLAVGKNDDSVMVHNCHSALREMEVLHDQLMRLLSKGTIQPRDIIIMSPDIAQYVPYINAVFGNGELKNVYSISDRTVRDTSLVINAFMDIISIHKSRFEASVVLDLFNVASIRSKYGVDDARFLRIRRWVMETNIRWGVDGGSRAESGSARFDDFSWIAGLKRMLMGFALVNESEFDDNAVDEILPYDDIEGDDAVALGSFVTFLERLFDLRKTLSVKRNVAEWGAFLHNTIDFFFASDNDSYVELSALRKAVGRLVDDASSAEMNCEIELDVIMENLDVSLRNETNSNSFMRGKMTFCSMVPMRSIPAKVIAIVGMNDGEFPRRDIITGFNLMGNRVLVCDRSRRVEDRYLFLEAILSARENLLFFYQGQTSKGDQEFPPAVPLAEFIDYIRQAFTDKADPVIFRHKLQAFDFDYFIGGSGLFSYSGANFKGAKSLAAMLNAEHISGGIWRSCSGLLPDAEFSGTIELRDLENFLVNPAAFFLSRNAGTSRFEMDSDVVEDDEMFDADSLESYQLRSRIGQWTAGGIQPEKQYERLRKESALPVGTVGVEEFRKIYDEISGMNKYFRDSLTVRIKKDICVTIGNVTIKGKADVLPDGLTQVYYRYSDMKSKDAVRFYIRHLLLCIMNEGRGDTISISSMKKGCEKILKLKALYRNTAESEIKSILEIYRRGQSSVLPLFPKASFEYAEKEGGHEEKMSAAEKVFSGRSEYNRTSPDIDDRYVGALFSDADWSDQAFISSFAELAEIVYKPFFTEDREWKYGMLEEEDGK